MEEVEEILLKSKILLLEENYVHKADVCSHDNCKQRENIASKREDLFKYQFRTCFGKHLRKNQKLGGRIKSGVRKMLRGMAVRHLNIAI